MEPGTNAQHGREAPTTDDIDETYSEVDPEDVTEDAIDFFSGDPRTERAQDADDDEQEDAT
jgi:hypothetical protein